MNDRDPGYNRPTTTDAPQRLAGKWDLDARAAGGPRVQLEFDAAMLREMKQAG